MLTSHICSKFGACKFEPCHFPSTVHLECVESKQITSNLNDREFPQININDININDININDININDIHINEQSFKTHAFDTTPV